MSWLQSLDQIADAAPSSVGYNAYYLSQVRRHQLPVAPGWVLTAPLWHTILSQMAWPRSDQIDNLATLNLNRSEGLQQLSQAWQTAFEAVCQAQSLEADALTCPLSHWVMRPSLWIDRQPPLGASQLLPLHSLLADRVGAGTGSLIWQGLQQLWRQALKARNLVVWQQHCQALTQLALGAVLLPLYPAQASGRLILEPGIARIEAVEGLMLCLSQGEAIPARCRIELGNPNQIRWQPGYQEQAYHPSTRVTAAIARPPTPRAEGGEADPEHLIQVTEHPPGELSHILDDSQVEALLQLAHQVQTVLMADGTPARAGHRQDEVTGRKASFQSLQMEWALSPSPGSQELQWVITQVMPWSEDGVLTQQSPRTLTPSISSSSPRARPQPNPPPLPQVSVVVRGIGASSGRVQATAIIARTPQDLPEPLPEGCIVVLPDLQPDRFLKLQSVAGIVIEQGGATCHAAILAREMGIPAVVGAPQATQLIDPNLVLWLDGERGLVYGMTEEVSAQLEQTHTAAPQVAIAPTQPHTTEPAVTPPLPPLRTKVMVNLSQSKRMSELPLQALDGVGLLRSEWLMLEILDQRHPWDWVNQGQAAELQVRLTQTLAKILEPFGDKPVRYRSLDLRSHEWQSLRGSPPLDTNPMLGLRGTLSYTVDSRLFEVELGALSTLQQSGHHNLQLMLPFVRSVEEVMTCQQYINYAGLNQNEGFALWIMAEVPSVLFLLPAYARAGVHGIAIGSNDLTQLLLAVDRDQHTIASVYDEQHPVVRMALAHIIQSARRCGMTCSICGQAPVRHPDLITDLVSWGIDSISVEMGALSFTRAAVYEAERNSGRS